CSATSPRRGSRGSSARPSTPLNRLLREQPRHVVPDGGEEHEGLLAVHCDAAEVLVADGGEAPQPRRVLVERIERMAREDEREPEERRRDERRPEIRERGRRTQLPRHERPPEEQATDDEQSVLDVQRPAGVERPVVEAGEMRPVPRCEPSEDGPPRADSL